MKTRKKRILTTPSDVDQVIDLFLLGHINRVIANKVGIDEPIVSRIISYYKGSNNGGRLSTKVISYMNGKYGLPRKEMPTHTNKLVREQPPYYETKLFFGLITIRSFPKLK